jgi:bcr-type benzoyl-CoA reductase subunit C
MSSQLVKPFLNVIRDNHLNSLSREGKELIGYFCTYTPIEVIHAAGFIPTRIMGEVDRIEKADSLTPNFICPFMRRTLEKGLKGEFDRLSGIVQGYTCDVTCGLINIWEENIGGKLYHTIPLPYNDNPDARSFFRSTIRELIEKLDGIGGRFTEEALEQSLTLYDRIRSLILDLYHMRYRDNLPLSAPDLLNIVLAGFIAPPEEYLKLLEVMVQKIKDSEPKKREGIPVLVSGSIVEEPKIMEIVEESGGKVVADDLCTGFRHFFPPGGEGQSPLDQLIDRYINRFPCPSRTRARNRSPLIIELIRRSGSSGVIFLFQKFCTPHLADHPIITEELRRENIPSIMIEMEETGINEGQLRTRFEGFFEMLRG